MRTVDYGVARLGTGKTVHFASQETIDGKTYTPDVNCGAAMRGRSMTMRFSAVNSFRVIADREERRQLVTCQACLK